MARRRRGAACDGEAGGGRRHAGAQRLRPLPPAGLCRGRSAGPAGPASCSSCAARARRACSATAAPAGPATSTTTFATLDAQIPLGLNTGLSRACRTGARTSAASSTPCPRSSELYARWFQFGAFCPIFRSHGRVWREHVPWAHGPAVEDDLPQDTRAALPAPALHLHARLAGARPGSAAHAAAVAQLPRRSRACGIWASSISGATTCWWRRSPATARGTGPSTCRRAPGSTSGRRSATREAAASRSRLRSSASRCSSAKAPSFRWGRSCSTPASGRSTR